MTQTDHEPLTISAYLLPDHEPMSIVPASKFRDWMDDVHGHYAYRCLPMLMANQWGWVVLNSHRIALHWDGTNGVGGLHLAYLKKPKHHRIASSTFGYGIVTFELPYLFRTPRGYNMQVRGLPNHIKKGIQPLEGIVETDWLPMPFTMNWKVTHPNELIVFDEGDPICMIVPRRRHELESFQPSVGDLSEMPDQGKVTLEWRESRTHFVTEGNQDKDFVATHPWQGTYFRGQLHPDHDAQIYDDHQTKLRLALFKPEWVQETR